MKKDRSFLTRPLMVMLSLVGPGIAVAQSPTPGPDSTALSLGEVVVSSGAGALSTERALTSVTVVPTERIDNQMITTTGSCSGRCPA